MNARQRLVGLALGCAVMLGCGSYQAPAMTAAKTTVAASHDMIEGLCEVGFARAQTEADFNKAKEQCDVMRLSYETAATAVEAWEKYSSPQACTESTSTPPTKNPAPKK